MRIIRVALVLSFAVAPGLAQTPPRSRPAPPAPDALAQPGRPGWVVDARSGCWVWAAEPPPGVTVSWIGACPHGPASGTGTVEWRRMAEGLTWIQRYVGALREGRGEGRGTTTHPNGDRYEGEFREGREQGRGLFTWANGSRYEGEFRDGQPSGRGLLITANGSRLEGEFREGRLNGQATARLADGTRYEGAWRDNRPDGQGAGFAPQTASWQRGLWVAGCHRAADGTRWALGRPLSECP